ncbi:MAG: tRNA (adenosine(37)-N6)-threonylcarbamoyltransferase complex ATPase subunit type 1 TsaE [Candidatus Azambacteria bacterium]|nr:tRNA (adenosine(37)-N6)-threonylcarbamoyltransferase complex ATPase subunit type 1 TsaE [Candidatus Azambacteria bacterium]
MPTNKIITNSSQETKKAGMELAMAIKDGKTAAKYATVIAFEGDLGSGKTTFIQGLAAELGVKENVLSPTFVIQKDFSLSLENYKNFYHIDAYRLKNSEELLELGFSDLVKNPENIIVIEWADKIKNILPSNVININFENLGEDKRRLIINFKI